MTDKALLVGVNTYPDAPLAGCVNDVIDMAQYLTEEHGFKPVSIRLLTDKRATTAAILSRLAWLVRGARSGDRLVFHFSGHGTQVADRNGDEIDGMDEVICPVDFDWDAVHMITDDKFNELFKALPTGVKFAWISDCCHSGTLTRDFFAPSSGAKTKLKKNVRNRYLTPPVDHAWRHQVVKSDQKAITSIQPTGLNVAFVSGCRDNQTSADAEFKGRPNGALTYFLLQALRKQKNAPIAQIVDTTRLSLKRNGYSQVPQADGQLVQSAFLA